MDAFADYNVYTKLLTQLGFVDEKIKTSYDKLLIEIWSLVTYIYNTEMKVSSLYNFLCCL